MTYTLTLLPGDGIGPEITAVTRRVLEALSQRFEFAIKFNEFAFGGASIDQFGEPLTEDR